MRIAHLSDIHIRLKERHDEYKEVFENLYKELKVQRPDRILLAGDIVHSKITLSPELVSMTRAFFMRLQEIAPVDLIVGNHDMNMSNMDRMDALSPIVDVVKDHGHGLTYYTESGVHPVGMVQSKCKFRYGVYSLLDGGDVHLKKRDKEDDIVYIALYHGAVSGCKLDNEYVFSDSSTSLNTFQNFDFIMLGDIHRRQFLNDSKTAAYPGSLIQQNHGEDMDKGFLMWDIRGRDDFDVEFIKVHNDYAYYTIEADDEEGLPDIKLPSKTRIRVVWRMKAQDISRSKASKLNSAIREKYKPLSVQLTFKPIGSNSYGDVNVDHSTNLADPDVQADLLRQWFKNLDEEVDVDKLMRIDQQITETVTNSEFEDFSNSNWHIKKVTMENFMSYAGPVEIDFDAMRGVIGLFGDNTAGKSVIIDAVLYALFNKTTRDVKNEDLVNKVTGDEVCRVKLHIVIKGVEYEIDRWTTRQYQKRSGRFLNARTDVTLNRRYNEDDEWENLTETQRNETEKIIRNAIGSFDDFMITTLSTQGGESEFMKLRRSPRADAMLRFLGLDVFNRKYEYAKDMLKQIESERRGWNKGNEIELLDTKKDMLAKQEALQAKYDRKVKSLDDEIDSIRKDISRLTGMINTTIKIDKDGDTLRAELDQTTEDVNQLKIDRKALKAKIKDLVSKVEELETKYVIDPESMIEVAEDRDTADRLQDLIRKAKAEITSIKRVLGVYRDELSNENKCPVADDSRHTTCAYLKGYIDKKDKAKGLLADVEKLQAKVRDYEAELEQVSYAYDVINEQGQIRNHIQIAVGKIETMRRELGNIESKIEVKGVSLKLIESQLKIADNNEETIKNNKEYKSQIATCELNLSKTIKEREAEAEEREKASGRIILLRKEISDIESTLEKIRQSDVQYNLFNIYCNAMHRKGLPVDVLKGYIPKINYEINKILSDVVDFGVYLKIDEGETDIDIVMRYDGEVDDTRPAQMASGMEKLLINMAIRYALLSVSNLNTPSSWFIDEGFGVLDAENLFSMARFFENVKGVFRNIVIITHIDSLKDVADWVINIEKKGGISLVNPAVKNI